MPAYTQEGRSLKVTTQLGRDKFLVSALTGREGLSVLSEYRVLLLSEEAEVSGESILGTDLSVELVSAEGTTVRQFNGFVTRFEALHPQGRMFAYLATVRPWLWFLTRQSNCRIFQEKTPVEIITSIFRDAGLPDFRESLSGTYAAREYCVQYNETDYDFVCRLMESEGIYFFFEHAGGRHKMVLADSRSAHQALSGDGATLEYWPDGGSGGTEASISEWRAAKEITSGTLIHSDYDFEKPRASLEARTQSAKGHAHGDGQIYEYPGIYKTTSAGTAYTRNRLEALQVGYEQYYGTTPCRTMGSGGTFDLIHHPRDAWNTEYLVTSADFTITAGSPDIAGGDDEYTCAFTAIRSQVNFRPQRATPKPVVRGPQTALVVGKSGEEVWIDKYGRVKVQFHWDRLGHKDENSSCWVRVAQGWAGKKWGMIFTPRIGHEVVVSFLEGDPDRPMVTGSVYNSDNLPPYTLPEDGTKSTIKSRSSKEGTAENFNEIRFEDKKDSEEIYVHAEKDMNRVVENNDTLKVGFEKKDKGNQTIDIFNNQTLNVGAGAGDAEKGDQTLTVYHDRTVTIGNDEKVKIGFDRKNKGDQTVEIFNNHTLKVGTSQADKGDQAITVFHDRTLEVGHDEKVTVKNDKTDDIKKKLSITVGDTCIIEATTSIELKVGSSSIKIEAAKITIKSTEIAVSGDAKVEIKSGGIGSVEASAPLTLKGAVVQIN